MGDVAIRIAAAAAVLACCGGLNALFDDDGDETKRRTTAGGTTPSPTRPSPSPTSYSPPPTRSAAPPSPTANPLDTVDKGDCLKNTGTDYDPEMVPVACGPGTYQVLRRVYGTIDPNQCRSVSGATTTYTVTYYLNNIPQISRSYVFCMKRR